MTREELAINIFNISHLFGNFKLRSGTQSNEYFDKYRFESEPKILNAIAQQLAELIDFDFDFLAGLEMGGIPISTALSLHTERPQIFVRKKPKEYGTCKFAEGPDITGKNLLIIEDVVTSGGQVVISTNDLRKSDAIIDTALCVIDRESGGTEALAAQGIKLISLFTMSEIKQIIGKK